MIFLISTGTEPRPYGITLEMRDGKWVSILDA